jgi:hypothetical protein
MVHVLTQSKGKLSLKQFEIVEDVVNPDCSFPNAPRRIHIMKKQDLIIELQLSGSI